MFYFFKDIILDLLHCFIYSVLFMFSLSNYDHRNFNLTTIPAAGFSRDSPIAGEENKAGCSDIITIVIHSVHLSSGNASISEPSLTYYHNHSKHNAMGKIQPELFIACNSDSLCCQRLCNILKSSDPRQDEPPVIYRHFSTI